MVTFWRQGGLRVQCSPWLHSLLLQHSHFWCKYMCTGGPMDWIVVLTSLCVPMHAHAAPSLCVATRREKNTNLLRLLLRRRGACWMMTPYRVNDVSFSLHTVSHCRASHKSTMITCTEMKLYYYQNASNAISQWDTVWFTFLGYMTLRQGFSCPVMFLWTHWCYAIP